MWTSEAHVVRRGVEYLPGACAHLHSRRHGARPRQPPVPFRLELPGGSAPDDMEHDRGAWHHGEEEERVVALHTLIHKGFMRRKKRITHLF